MKTHPEKGAQIVAKILHNSDDKQFRKDLGKHFDAELGKIFIQQRTALEAYYEGAQAAEGL